MQEQQQQQGAAAILPGLPDDVSLRCLALLPRSQHAKLRCVCTCWRDLVTKGLTSFHTLRRNMGLTHDYLVLLSTAYPYNNLGFSEIHLSSGIPFLQSAHFRIQPFAERDLRFLDYAYIPIGPFVLILGGCYSLRGVSDRLDIFDISSGFWRRGASMLSTRYRFAWGVIDNLLYVAGSISVEGCADEYFRVTRGAEVYDFDADKWSRVADMPLFTCIDYHFVYKKALYVGGRTGCSPKLFSYKPLLDQWNEEHITNWDSSTHKDKKVISIQDCEVESLYMLEIQPDKGLRRVRSSARKLKVLKFEQETSKWNLAYQARDPIENGSDCRWTKCGCPDFVSMGKKPVLMDHRDDESQESDDLILHTRDGVVKLIDSRDVLRISVDCPSRWGVVVINA